MEKSEAVRRFNEGKHFVETCLEQIASLEQSNDKELRKALRGTVMVEVSYKAAENFGKVCCYVLDGKDGAQKLKDKLFDLKEKVVQLYNGADRQNLITIKTISETIISEIKEVEEWAGDELFIHNPIPETGENGCLSTGDNSEGEDSGDGGSEYQKRPKTSEEIREKLKAINPFEQAKQNEVIPFPQYYTKLTNGIIVRGDGTKKVFQVIDNEKCDLDLFESCVRRADISDIIKDGQRTFARLFMFYVATKFKDRNGFIKAAAKSFNLQSRLSAIDNAYKADFIQLMGGLFTYDKPKI